MELRDQWQRLVTPVLTPVAGDLAGTLQAVRAVGTPPSAGRFLYIDAGQVEAGSTATPYIHTDSAAASRAGSRWVA